jgi:hypothetical protein
MVNCSVSLGLARDHGTIVDSFQTYRYKKIKLVWVPTNGPNDSDAGTIIKMQYISNPEDIVYYSQTATSLNAINFINATYNYKVWNAWQHREFNINLTDKQRRTWYTVDYAPTTSTVNDHERMSQGMIAVTFEKAVNNAVVLGQYKIVYELELRGLSSTPGT